MAGEVTDPDICPMCETVVKDESGGLQCDGFCDKWHHTSCVKVSDEVHEKIKEIGESVLWWCPACSANLSSMRSRSFPLVDYCKLHELVGAVLETVKGVVNDNLAINEKLLTLSSDQKAVSKELSRLRPVISKLRPESIASDSVVPIDQSKSTVTDKMTARHVDTKDNLTPELPSGDITTSQLDENEFPALPSPSADSDWKTATYKKKRKPKVTPDIVAPSTVNNRNGSGLARKTAVMPVNTNSIANKNKSSYGRKISASSSSSSVKHISEKRIIVGTSDKSNLVAGSKKAWFYLGRVKQDTTAEAVKEFVTSTFQGPQKEDQIAWTSLQSPSIPGNTMSLF